MKSLVTIIVLLFSQVLFCQKDDTFFKNAFYFETLGHTRSIISINYERSVYRINDYISFNLRTGLGYEGGYKDKNDKRHNSAVTIPNVALVQIGRKKHYANLGIGYSVSFASSLVDDSEAPIVYYPRFDSAYSFSMGYRYSKESLFLQAYPVIINAKNSNHTEFSFGMSFGMTW